MLKLLSFIIFLLIVAAVGACERYIVYNSDWYKKGKKNGS